MSGPEPEQVRDEMVALKEPERRKRAKEAAHDFDKVARSAANERPSNPWRAAALAWLGTATARTITANFWRVMYELDRDPEFTDDAYLVLASRGRAFFETLARGVLRSEGLWRPWPLVRRGVREGLIDQPEGDEYLQAFLFGVGGSLWKPHDVDSTYAGLLADPGLLEREVWQIFEVDLGGALTSNWLSTLKRLADEGRLDRARLLDASLDALMRDFRPSGVGSYAELHEALEPTREERIERLDRYLALVTSPAPAVVKEGLAALREVEDAVPPDAFARVAPTPFTQRQKNLSTETLAMLARLCKRHPDARPVLLESAAHALAHERQDVQERALKLLEQYADDVPRAALLSYVEAVSPTLRSRVEALTGVAAPQEKVAIEILPPVQPQLTLELVREVRAKLEPVESVDELIELAAMLVEGQGNGDDCERFLDGVSRLCDQRPRGFERRTAGLAKRVGRPNAWGDESLVATVVRAWTRRDKPRMPPQYSETMLGFLDRRTTEVAARAARGAARQLLAFPTHSGGWIEPEVLEERLQRTGRFRNRPDPADLLQSRVRAFPQLEPLAFAPNVKTTTHWQQTSRHFELVCPAPRELADLGPAVAHVGTGKVVWYTPVGWAGFDALGVRWALTVLPSLPEVGFAGAAWAAVAAREGAAYFHPEAVLEHAFDPHVPFGPEAWLAVAGCLVAKSPDLPRVAVDLCVASVEDGRFDADALGEAIAWLVDNDLAKVTRLEAPLRDAARVSPLHAAQVLRTIEALLARLSTQPRGLHAPLEVAVESATATGRRVENEQARAALERIAGEVSPSSKLGKLARALLAA